MRRRWWPCATLVLCTGVGSVTLLEVYCWCCTVVCPALMVCVVHGGCSTGGDDGYTPCCAWGSCTSHSLL